MVGKRCRSRCRHWKGDGAIAPASSGVQRRLVSGSVLISDIHGRRLLRLGERRARLTRKVLSRILTPMKGEFTAIIEESPEGGYWAICAEVPGANGQGEAVEEAKGSLGEAIRLILEDRLEDVRRGLPTDSIQTVIVV